MDGSPQQQRKQALAEGTGPAEEPRTPAQGLLARHGVLNDHSADIGDLRQRVVNCRRYLSIAREDDDGQAFRWVAGHTPF